MRPKKDAQGRLEFQASNLAITNRYFAKYTRISQILDANPGILDAVHADLERALQRANRKVRARGRFRYTSEHVLRILLSQVVEGGSLRAITIRIDDSTFLRRFTRLHEGPMMDFTTLCDLKNAIRPQTWQRTNDLLARHAIGHELITGDQLRVDTTAVETDIHWPTDSSLIWDTYRVLDRLLGRAREIAPELLTARRLHPRRVKRLHTQIHRLSRRKRHRAERQKRLYRQILGHGERIGTLAAEVAEGLRSTQEARAGWDADLAEALAGELERVRRLGLGVLDQARRRVLEGETVPNNEKLFSIFEPHTELLIRGKAGKEIEFGHMVEIQQVREKFITGYRVFAKRPFEPTLVLPAIDHHRELFGRDPQCFAADKGYYEGMDSLHRLERRVPVVSIAKKGSLTIQERQREDDPLFRLGQRFRAGVEGTISFLKRALGLSRCRNKTWAHYASTIGVAVLAHNLLVLARC